MRRGSPTSVGFFTPGGIMAFEIDMLACAAEEDRRSKRDELMQREEARIAAIAVFEARIGDYDRFTAA